MASYTESSYLWTSRTSSGAAPSCLYIYTYIHKFVCVCVYIYIYGLCVHKCIYIFLSTY